MSLFVANDSKLRQLLQKHGNDLSVAQGSAIKILLDIEQYRLPSGGHEHHKHPIAEDGHLTDKANLTRVSQTHHFLVHLSLAVLFKEHSHQYTVRMMSGRIRMGTGLA
jgi:hypothetical protein